MAAKHHVNLKVVEEFLRRKIYPKEIAKDRGKKANFRRTCKNFSIKDGELFYKKSRKVIFDEQQKIEISFLRLKCCLTNFFPNRVFHKYLYQVNAPPELE